MKLPYKNRFKLSINSNEIIITYIAFLGMFARLLPFQKAFEAIVMLDAIYLFGMRKKYSKVFTRHIDITVCLILTMVLFTLSALLHVDFQIIISNIHSSIKPMLLFLIVLAIATYNRPVISNFLAKSFWLFNLFWVANIVVLYFQISGVHLFIRGDWLALNPYYPDLCSGLFGFNGTHKLALYACFMLVYNIVYSKIWCKHAGRLVIIYTLITEVIMLLLSLQNDNIMIYVLIPMCYGTYWLFDMQWSGRKIGKKVKRIFATVAVLLVAIYFMVSTEQFQQEYWPRIIWRINRILFFNSGKYTLGGSNERLAIAEYALSQPDGWLLGKGVGMVRWGDAESFGFMHFGLNSLGSFITLGGIWFLVLNLAMYARISSCLAYANRNKDHYIGYYLICIIVYLVFSIYTIPLSDLITSIWISFIFVVLGQLRVYYCESRKPVSTIK